MDTCKHDWHFIEGSSRLRCQRCKQETGPWTTEHLTVPAGTGYAFANTTPSYTFVLHNADGKIGTLDFNGPEMVFTGDADKSAQVFFDHVGKYFDQRLKAEREAGRQEALANRPAQVSPLEFVTMTLEKEHLVGNPMIWAEWPNKENT